jgi:hypothetical protein
MENINKIGDIKRREQVGLKGRQKVMWSKCTLCGIEKWAMIPVKENYQCLKCNARLQITLGTKILNNYPHKSDCKCYRCRIGKGYFRGDKNPSWKGGIRKTSLGYIYEWVSLDSPFLCMAGSHKNEANYIMQHRLVMAKHLNRPLTKKETVHHINGIKDDNRIENLELWSSNHQSGQRIDDQIKWAIEFLNKHNYTIKKLKTQPL